MLVILLFGICFLIAGLMNVVNLNLTWFVPVDESKQEFTIQKIPNIDRYRVLIKRTFFGIDFTKAVKQKYQMTLHQIDFEDRPFKSINEAEHYIDVFKTKVLSRRRQNPVIF